MKESEHQQALIRWATIAKSKYPELELLYAIPNGSNTTDKNRIRLVAEGMKKGMPDLVLPVARGHYHALYLELKTKDGKLSKSQKDLHELLKETGNAVMISRSLEQSIQIIKIYLKQKTIKEL